MEKPNTVPLDLEAIERRANAASKGPWVKTVSRVRQFGSSLSDSWDVFRGSLENGLITMMAIRICRIMAGSEDAAFIAHAREDVPALVAEVRRLSSLPVPQPNAGLREAAGVIFHEIMEKACLSSWQKQIVNVESDRILALLPLGSGVQGEGAPQGPLGSHHGYRCRSHFDAPCDCGYEASKSKGEEEESQKAPSGAIAEIEQILINAFEVGNPRAEFGNLAEEIVQAVILKAAQPAPSPLPAFEALVYALTTAVKDTCQHKEGAFGRLSAADEAVMRAYQNLWERSEAGWGAAREAEAKLKYHINIDKQ